jgi:hypothetical protein
MVDRYTKIVLTVIAVILIGLLVRPLFDAQTVNAQLAACGTPETPCHVNIMGGPPGGAWQGAPIFVFDAKAEARAQTQQTCGTPATPCYAMIVGGPGSLGSWQGTPLVVIDSQRIVPRRNP